MNCYDQANESILAALILLFSSLVNKFLFNVHGLLRFFRLVEIHGGDYRKVEVGPAVVPNGRDYGAAIDAASGLSEL